jgi:hypothetical protein
MVETLLLVRVAQVVMGAMRLERRLRFRWLVQAALVEMDSLVAPAATAALQRQKMVTQQLVRAVRAVFRPSALEETVVLVAMPMPTGQIAKQMVAMAAPAVSACLVATEVTGAMLPLLAQTVLQRAATVVMVVTPEAVAAMAALVLRPGLTLMQRAVTVVMVLTPEAWAALAALVSQPGVVFRLMAPMETTHQAATVGPVVSVVSALHRRPLLLRRMRSMILFTTLTAVRVSCCLAKTTRFGMMARFTVVTARTLELAWKLPRVAWSMRS